MIGARIGIYSGKGAAFAWSNTPILDRVNDYIRFNQVITMPTQFTTQCWFYTDSLSTTQVLFAGNTGTGYVILAVKPASAHDISFADSGGASTFTFSGGVPINQWNHLIWSRNASNQVEMWLNGVASSSGLSTKNNTIAYARFGQYFNGAFPFGKNVNEIAMWHNYTGNGTDAAALYNSGAGAFASDVIPSPLLYLRCNEGSGTVLADLGSGATNADLVNVTGTYWGTH